MSTDLDLCNAWLEASRRAEIEHAIAEVHQEISEQIAQREPVCTASGRCCNFERFGHRLYTTGLETALTLDTLPVERTLKPGDVEQALQAGTCPFVVNRLCGIHPARPAGCRVYFCDPSASQWVNDLAERASDRIKAIHDTFEIEYRYMEWRALLSMFVDSKVVVVPTRPLAFAPSDPFVEINVDRA